MTVGNVQNYPEDFRSWKSHQNRHFLRVFGWPRLAHRHRRRTYRARMKQRRFIMQ